MEEFAQVRRRSVVLLAELYAAAGTLARAIYLDLQRSDGRLCVTVHTGREAQWRQVDQLVQDDGEWVSSLSGQRWKDDFDRSEYLNSLQLDDLKASQKAGEYQRTFGYAASLLARALDFQLLEVRSAYHSGRNAHYLMVALDGRDLFGIAEDGHAAMVSVPGFVPHDDVESQARWAVALSCPTPAALPRGNAIARRGARLLLAVQELHRRGFQNLSVRCFVSASGFYWRCELYVAGSGAPIGLYSSADEADYFGLKGSRGANFRQLADMIEESFSVEVSAAKVWNFENAGWVSSLIPWAEAGLLPIEFADYDDPAAIGLIKFLRVDGQAIVDEGYMPLPPSRLAELEAVPEEDDRQGALEGRGAIELGHGIGVDGCRAGWFWVRIINGGYKFGVCESFEELCHIYPDVERICVDIPIGLTDDPEGRQCDAIARQLLKKRASSVFSAPARSVLGCTDYDQAKAVSKATIGKALSRQAFAIVPKIREVDQVLRSNELLRDLVVEGHPEVCFYFLAGRPMTHGKKTQAGYEERRQLLTRFWPNAARCIDDALTLHRRKNVARDDIVDAIVLALTAAGQGRRGEIPDSRVMDEECLPMRMCFLRRG